MESDLKLRRFRNPSLIPQDSIDPRYEIQRIGSRLGLSKLSTLVDTVRAQIYPQSKRINRHYTLCSATSNKELIQDTLRNTRMGFCEKRLGCSFQYHRGP